MGFTMIYPNWWPSWWAKWGSHLRCFRCPQSPLAANWHLVRDLGLLAITNLNLKDFEPHQLQSVSPIHQHLLLARDLPNMFQPPLQLACRFWGLFGRRGSLKPAAPAAIFCSRARGRTGASQWMGLWSEMLVLWWFTMVYPLVREMTDLWIFYDMLWYFAYQTWPCSIDMLDSLRVIWTMNNWIAINDVISWGKKCGAGPLKRNMSSPLVVENWSKRYGVPMEIPSYGVCLKK